MTTSYQTTLTWARQTPDFSYDTFDRTHTLRLSPKVEIQSSSAADYAGNADLANPELLIAGALSTCHMLTFLAICAKSRLMVNSYDDSAIAELGKKDDGRIAVTRITLNPRVVFDASTPVDATRLKSLHDKAHHNCLIANSLACEMVIAS